MFFWCKTTTCSFPGFWVLSEKKHVFPSKNHHLDKRKLNKSFFIVYPQNIAKEDKREFFSWTYYISELHLCDAGTPTNATQLSELHQQMLLFRTTEIGVVLNSKGCYCSEQQECCSEQQESLLLLFYLSLNKQDYLPGPTETDLIWQYHEVCCPSFGWKRFHYAVALSTKSIRASKHPISVSTYRYWA